MPVSRSTLAYSTVAIVLFAIGTPSAPAQPATEKTAAASPAPSSVTAAGVTIHSVSVTLPDSDRVFPGGRRPTPSTTTAPRATLSEWSSPSRR